MGYNFLPWDHDQQYLLPPDIRDLLPGDYERWALLETASMLAFSDFAARRRTDGWGRAASHPAMMAPLLLYAYAQGSARHARLSGVATRMSRCGCSARTRSRIMPPSHVSVPSMRRSSQPCTPRR